jgi:hypothetical protein
MTGKISRAFGRSEITIQRTLQECGGGAGIKYLSCMEKREGPTPHSMCVKARARIHYGLMCGEWTDTGVKVTNVSRVFVLSPPGGGFKPKTFVS